MLTNYERIVLRKAKFMFKVFIQEAPLYICDMFEPTVVNNEARILRSISSNNFVISKPNKKCLSIDVKLRHINLECIVSARKIVKKYFNFP